jgi:hypothetical protein
MRTGANNVMVTLPSGVRVTRVWRRIVGSPAYVLPPGGGVLEPADVEALYADSISGDGGSNTPPPESHGERRR